MSIFTKYIGDRISKNKNFIACITGSTGSGKSYSAVRLGQILDPDFDHRNICFDAEELMGLIECKTKELTKGSCIVFDEIQVTMGHLNFQDIVSKCLNSLFQTFRHRNFILIMTSPHFDFINASLRKLFHCRMETVFINPQEKICCLKPLLLQINQRTGKIYNKYLRVRGVPIRKMNVGLPTKQLLDHYERRKTTFTNKVNAEIRKKLEDAKKKDRKTPTMDEVLKDWKAGLSARETSIRLGTNERNIFKYRKKLRDIGHVPDSDKKSGENGRQVGDIWHANQDIPLST